MNQIKKHPEAITRSGEYENPFLKSERADHLSHGAVAIESERAVAQIQAKVIAAKKFPRDQVECFERVREACKSLSLAEAAFYTYPRGGEMVRGATIRLAEELAQIWGNIDVQTIELSRREGETELQAVAWDLETNASSAVGFTVKHHLDTRNGRRELTDQRDIRDLTANISARKIRGRILAILPEALVAAAIDMCHDTLARSISADLDNTRAAIIGQLKQYGVTERAILKKFDLKTVNALDARCVTSLSAIYRTIKAGEASASEIFEQGLTSQQIRERKSNPSKQPAAVNHVPDNDRNETKQPSPVAEPKQVPTPAPAKKTEPKKGTMAWYKKQITDRGETPAKGARASELQAQYAELLEAEHRANRQGADADTEQKKPSEDDLQADTQMEAPEPPPAVAYDDDDDWFNE